MLDLASLMGPSVAVVLFAFSFDANPFVLDGRTCVGRLGLDVDAF